MAARRHFPACSELWQTKLPMTQKDNDRQLCWERVLKSNQLFRISHLFAPPELSGKLLALHALFASVEQLSAEIREEMVARKKLEWWRFELSPAQIERSRHPVVRYLAETGAAVSLPSSALKSLLDAAEYQLDAQPPSNMKDFNHLCILIYQPRIVLEGALSGQEVDLADDQEIDAQEGGLLQLLRESFAQAKPGCWWLPLDTQARFGVTRLNLQEKHDAPAARAVFQHILGVGREQPVPGDRSLQRKRDLPAGPVHLQLTALLQRRQLQHLRSCKPSRFATELNRWHVSDLMAAWKLARQAASRNYPI
jgi:phytoene synthase